MDTTIGAYVRAQRERLGLSQGELARRAELSSSHMSQIEQGRITWPNADIRRRLARALGVSHLDMLVAAGELSAEEVAYAGATGVVEERPDDPGAELCRWLQGRNVPSELAELVRRQVEAFEAFARTAAARR